MVLAAMVSAACLAGAACGSTIQRAAVTDDRGFASGGGDTPEGATSAADGGAASGGGGAASQGGTTGGTHAATQSSVTAGATGSTPGASARIPGRTQGVTDKTINVGILYVSEAAYSEGFSQIGVKGAAPGDAKAMAQAVIDEINANGGIAGRKVVPLYLAGDSTGAQDTDTGNQAACSHYTQDNKVAVIITLTSRVYSMLPCLVNANTPLVAEFDYNEFADKDYAKYRNFLYQPGSMSLDKYGAVIDVLHSSGYFTKGPAVDGHVKVGIIRFDYPQHDHLSNDIVKPALARYGFKVAPEDDIAISDPQSLNDLGGSSSQISSAVLKFRQDNVTHVLFLATGGWAEFVFGPTADNQMYYPRYGVSSFELTQVTTKNVSTAQFHDGVMAGWWPGADVEQADDPGGIPAAAACDATMQKGKVPMPSRVAVFSAQLVCQGLLFVKDALDHAPEISPAGMRAGVDSMGTRFQAASTFKTLFGRNRNDGTHALRPLLYHDDCSCFRYSGSLLDLP